VGSHLRSASAAFQSGAKQVRSMNTSTDDEWMRVEDALAVLGMSRADAIEAICSRAYNGLIKAKAKQYIDGSGRRFSNVELHPEFWWSAREIGGNWRTGDLTTTSPDSAARLQAFGVTFRRLDIEQMIPPMPQGARGASLSSAQARAGSNVTGATDGDDDWISAAEARDLLPFGLGARAICKHAKVGLVTARAKLYIYAGQQNKDVPVPSEFWWAEGGEALEQDWSTGHFGTWISNQTVRLEAFGVQFRRAEIEQLKPATAAKRTPSPSSAQSPAPVPSRKIFIVHGRDENAKNEVALFLRKIGLEDIVLHQRPNRGRHLLTKFQEEANGASFAVVLMTPDDVGGLAGKPLQERARQNVVFELGFFIGQFGTPRVAALIVPGVEKPSDFDGICWIDFGRATNWKNELARELKEAGVPFDPDKILHA
jgi:predicted nucleotide-binding protein